MRSFLDQHSLPPAHAVQEWFDDGMLDAGPTVAGVAVEQPSPPSVEGVVEEGDAAVELVESTAPLCLCD